MSSLQVDLSQQKESKEKKVKLSQESNLQEKESESNEQDTQLDRKQQQNEEIQWQAKDKFLSSIIRQASTKDAVKELKDYQKELKNKRFFSRWFSLSEFRFLEIYRAALLEFVGSCLLCFITECGIISVVTSDQFTPWNLATSQSVPLLLFIFAINNTSGAHFNPLITFATWLTCMTSFPRMVVYIISQFGGMILGSFFMRIAQDNLQQEITTLQIGGLS